MAIARFTIAPETLAEVATFFGNYGTTGKVTVTLDPAARLAQFNLTPYRYSTTTITKLVEVEDIEETPELFGGYSSATAITVKKFRQAADRMSKSKTPVEVTIKDDSGSFFQLKVTGVLTLVKENATGAAAATPLNTLEGWMEIGHVATNAYNEMAKVSETATKMEPREHGATKRIWPTLRYEDGNLIYETVHQATVYARAAAPFELTNTPHPWFETFTSEGDRLGKGLYLWGTHEHPALTPHRTKADGLTLYLGLARNNAGNLAFTLKSVAGDGTTVMQELVHDQYEVQEDGTFTDTASNPARDGYEASVLAIQQLGIHLHKPVTAANIKATELKKALAELTPGGGKTGGAYPTRRATFTSKHAKQPLLVLSYDEDIISLPLSPKSGELILAKEPTPYNQAPDLRNIAKGTRFHGPATTLRVGYSESTVSSNVRWVMESTHNGCQVATYLPGRLNPRDMATRPEDAEIM